MLSADFVRRRTLHFNKLVVDWWLFECVIDVGKLWLFNQFVSKFLHKWCFDKNTDCMYGTCSGGLKLWATGGGWLDTLAMWRIYPSPVTLYQC